MVLIKDFRANELKNNFHGKKIAVIGDMMVDAYLWGDAKRISPEAPVPVVEVEEEFYRFGGAANVANNILHLGGIPFPLGVLGDDRAGEIFKDLLAELKIDQSGLICENDRPTTIKTRVIAGTQHVVRIDKEKKSYISSETGKKLFEHLESMIDELDGIILQDYNKGVLSTTLIRDTIALCKAKGKLVTVDPKFANFFEYQDVTVFKPNRKEAGDVLGISIVSEEDISKAGELLIKKLNASNILLTLGEGGIAVFEKDGNFKRMPTKARKVADVSGAGDTVISTLTMALSAGANIYEASFLANYAGGIVCEEVGIVPVKLDNLFNSILDY